VHDVIAVVGLVALAVAGAAVADRLRTPAPSLLVLLGLGVGLLPGVPTLQLSPDLVLLGVLPPLLYAAAQQVSLPDLRAVWLPVTVLAVGLVAISAAAVAGLTHLVEPSIGVAVAFTLGAVLASTDPVAVTALSRQLRLPERIATIVQSESLFNDATSLVLFQVAAVAVTTGGLSGGATALRFVQLGGGGIAVGAIVGLLAATLLGRGGDPTVLTALSVVTPYAAAVTAQAVHASSVTAVIVAGLMVAERRAHRRQPSGRLQAAAVYDTLVFVLENGIFAVIGVELATFLRDLPDADRSRAAVLAVLVTATLLVVRALGLLLTATVANRRAPDRNVDGAGYRLWQAAAVVTWAGARGVIPLAAALSIPLTVDAGGPFPHRPLLLVVATAAVVVSLVVQGTTLRPLVRRLGVVGDAEAIDRQRNRARYSLVTAALAHLEEVASTVDADDAVVRQARTELEGRADHLRGLVHAANEGRRTSTSYRDLRLRLVEVEAAELSRLRSAGKISAEVFRELQRQLDLEATRLQR
jgi:Na+/H+ antiporter